VIAIIFAEDFSRFSFAKEFKNEIAFFTLIMFFPIFFEESDTTQLAPLFRASLTNLFPLFFLPLSAKNKLPFLLI